jgi:hypothetical protein
MLSDLERQRLQNRESEKDPKIRAINDMRVKKKLRNWLKGIDDVSLIFRCLPDQKLNKELEDHYIFGLLGLASQAMSRSNFGPIEGIAGDPDKWILPLSDRSANKEDVRRALVLYSHMQQAAAFLGNHNPIPEVLKLSLIQENSSSELIERLKLTDGEIKAIQLIEGIVGKSGPVIMRRGKLEKEGKALAKVGQMGPAARTRQDEANRLKAEAEALKDKG